MLSRTRSLHFTAPLRATTGLGQIGTQRHPRNISTVGNTDSFRDSKCTNRFPRPHVNPLAARHCRPIALRDDWLQHSFPDAYQNPVIIDIGCAKGSWALCLGPLMPCVNIIGLEIRGAILEYALSRKLRPDAPKNVNYLVANANVDLSRILSDIRKVSYVHTVTLQFPDPLFKLKHKKRRVLTPNVLRTIVDSLLPAGKDGHHGHLFVQTDVKEVMTETINSIIQCDLLGENKALVPSQGFELHAPESNANPFPAQTEREITTIKNGKPIYRMMFDRVPVETTST